MVGMEFWKELPKPFFALAPMEAVTDVAFRHVVAKAGRPDVYFTEFTNTASYASEKGRWNAEQRLVFKPSEQPIVAQIWGSVPENFAITAAGCAEMGYRAVDLNMGCPEKNVVKTGGGSGLILDPERAGKIIAATKTAGLPVSVKTRLGFTRTEEWRDWLTFVLRQDVVNLTIHLRTRKEMSVPAAHHELIPEIVKLRDEIAPQTTLCVNGDVRDRAHGMEIVRENPGVDGLMIGRGVFRDVFCFSDGVQATKESLLELLELHLDEFDKMVDGDESRARRFDPLKRFFKIYVRDFPNAAEMRAELMECKTTTEARAVLGARVW
ncbi:tRNA-dihydrouridine synthase family protein [Candidatus Saccharibacteria bacterium]|nr:tRNA-dihydrouridine synthase family protein [Candidatus Saccharibacteria bacterium]